jgi:phosphate transport system substrate-binding protein
MLGWTITAMTRLSMRGVRTLLAALCLLSSAMLMQTAAAAESRLVITGSSTVAPLVLEIAKRFESRNPGVRIDVQSGGSSRGIADARSGVAQIGMVSRALKADEGDLVAHTIAMDGIALIVHRSNPVSRLTDEQVRAVYRGEVSNWRDVGGPQRPITVVNKAEGRSTLELFLQHFGLKNSEVRAQVVIGENQQGIKTVAGNPGAVGYVSIGTADYEAAHGAAIRPLPMAGVEASVESVRGGRFPLSRPLNLVTAGRPGALEQRFIVFAQSKAVDDLIQAQYFVASPR